MGYLGGKFRIRKILAQFLSSKREVGQIYFEPFLGGANVFAEMQDKKIGSDVNTPLINMFIHLINGWEPPSNLSEDEYKQIKLKMDYNDPLTAFAGICCSFSGKWFGGYSRDQKTNRNFASNGRNTLLKLKNKILNAELYSLDYKCFSPNNQLIYCDPPYINTTKYSFCDDFNHEEFWEKMREWSNNNTVYISEYVAPKDFECVLEIKTKTDLNVKGIGKEPRIERLFKYKG